MAKINFKFLSVKGEWPPAGLPNEEFSLENLEYWNLKVVSVDVALIPKSAWRNGTFLLRIKRAKSSPMSSSFIFCYKTNRGEYVWYQYAYENASVGEYCRRDKWDDSHLRLTDRERKWIESLPVMWLSKNFRMVQYMYHLCKECRQIYCRTFCELQKDLKLSSDALG